MAHKYGFYPPKAIMRNDVGIVYTPEPILISMFTNNNAAPIAKYLVLMVDWSKYCAEMRQGQEGHGCSTISAVIT